MSSYTVKEVYMKLCYAKEIYLFDEEAVTHKNEFDLSKYRDVIYSYSFENKQTLVLIYYHHNLDENKLNQVRVNGNEILWLNKPDNSFTKELITVTNAHWFKPEPDDIVIYIGRGRLPEQAHINGNCGNPFTVQEYGRGIALAKYIQSKPDLTNLIELVRPYFGKQRIVLLCWCKPNKCHGDYIKQQLMRELL